MICCHKLKISRRLINSVEEYLMYEFKSLNFYCQFKITDTNKTTTCLILLTIYFCGLLGTVLIKLNIIVETLPSVSLSVNVSTLIKKKE